MKYEVVDKVLASECSSLAQLSIIGAVEKIQDHICEFFGQLNIDQRTLRAKHNAMWVFTRNKIKFCKPLDWDESVVVRCFITKITSLTMEIDCAIYNKNNEVAIYSRVEICLLDFSSKKIKKIDELCDIKILNSEMPIIYLEFNKLRAQESCRQIASVRVGASCIDFCQHTNNTQYIKFIIDCYKVKDLENLPLKSVEISYNSQTFESDLLDICCDEKVGEYKYFCIKKDGTTVAKCKFNYC